MKKNNKKSNNEKKKPLLIHYYYKREEINKLYSSGKINKKKYLEDLETLELCFFLIKLTEPVEDIH